MSTPSDALTVYKLEREEELRVEVDSTVSITLTEGDCELFGTEFALQHPYAFSKQKLAIFTWHGCTLEVRGRPEHVYKASDTPMPFYANLHFALETMRDTAAASGSDGPRMLICGPTDSGKTSLTSLLLNYAVKRGRKPIFGDLDIGQGTITCPGTLSCTVVEQPFDVEEGLQASSPLVYFFGHVSPMDNPKRFRTLVERLASNIDARFVGDPDVRASGLICNTMGWVDGLGYELLVHTCHALRVNVIVVIEHDRLYASLEADLLRAVPTAAALPVAPLPASADTNPSTPPPATPAQNLVLVKAPKSGGVVTRNPQYRRMSRSARFRAYFHGVSPLLPLSPTLIHVRFDEVHIYRIWGGIEASSTILPKGAQPVLDPLRLIEEAPTADLLHSMVAVLAARTADDVPTANVLGFVHVRAVDTEKATMDVLAPSPGALPSPYLLVGSLKWVE